MATRLWEGTKSRGSGTLGGVYYEAHQCGVCGVKWAMEHDFMEERREDGEGWRCPNGHSFVFNGGESRAEQLERQLRQERERAEAARRRLQATRDLLAHEERSHAATRGHVTRKRRELERTKAGVCPVDGCRRHFSDLERHMSSKHPGFKP